MSEAESEQPGETEADPGQERDQDRDRPPPEGDPAGRSPGTTGPPPPAPGAAHGDDDGEDQAYGDLSSALGQRVYNNFYGTVDASNSAFGTGPARNPGLVPGTVEPTEVDQALRVFLPPAGFHEAAVKLESEHLLVLTGDQGDGRRAGAFALLRGILGTSAALHSLSPADSLVDLAAHRALKSGHGYAILDYVGGSGDGAVQEHGTRQLQRRLRRQGSYLVITTSGAAINRRVLSDFCVEWNPPPALRLFDHCVEHLGPGVAPGEIPDRIREQVGALRRPAEVVAVAESLRGGTDAALAALEDGANGAVQRWFDGDPPVGHLLPVAALAFCDGLPERVFEELWVSLDHLVRSGAPGESGASADERPETAAPGIRQSRAEWRARADGLVEPVRRPGPGQDHFRSERRITFVSGRVRAAVVGELHSRYGYEFWHPARQWLSALAGHRSLEVRTEAALGVALLARHGLSEVEETLLEPWASGQVNQRLTAAFVLQFMCRDEGLGPHALNKALAWRKDGGPQRAMTAAMAFAGELGSLYRLEALNSLWDLAERGQRISVAARRSLVLSLATAENEPERALVFLRYLRTRAARAQQPKARALALAIIVQILGAGRLEAAGAGSPLAALLLRNEPRSAAHLGSLWATALLSTGRSAVVSALCRTLAALHEGPAAQPSVHALGEAMRAEMSRAQWAALRHDVSTALRHPDYELPGARRLAQVLFGSLHARIPATTATVPGG